MNCKITVAIAVCAGLYMFGAQASLAQPMRCSGEQKTCVANCLKNPNPTTSSRCVKTCHLSQSICLRTGCWDSGSFRYCGLMKQ